MPMMAMHRRYRNQSMWQGIGKFRFKLWSKFWLYRKFVIRIAWSSKISLFDFSRWHPPPSWIVEFLKFYWRTESAGPRCIIVPNFVKIGGFVAEILRFFEFSRWPPPPSWIFEIAKLYWLLWCIVSNHISVPNFVKIGLSVAKILRFFDFSRWQTSAILDLFAAYLDHLQWVLGGSLSLSKICYDRCSSFYNINISIFDAFGWKMLIHAPKIEVLGQFDPLNGLQYQLMPKKAHPCITPRHLSH